MFKFIGKALAGLVLTKDARMALEQANQPKSGGARAGAGHHALATPPKPPGAVAAQAALDAKASEKDEAIAEAQAAAENLVTPDRAELIRNAMRVRNAKQAILADLNDEDRAKLVAAAMKALMREGK